MHIMYLTTRVANLWRYKMKRIIIVAIIVFLTFISSALQTVSAAVTKPDISEMSSGLVWPEDGDIVDGELEPENKGMFVVNSSEKRVFPVDDQNSYTSINESFLIPTLVTGVSSANVKEDGEVVSKNTDELTFFVETEITFGTYDGSEGWKGAGVHIRGYAANQMRVRILRDLGQKGSADLFIEHVDNGVGTELATVTLPFTAEEGDTLDVEILSTPTSLSVWVNNQLFIDEITTPELPISVGMYYAHNEALFNDFAMVFLDDIVGLEDGFVSTDLPEGNENIFDLDSTVSSDGHIWSTSADLTLSNQVVSNTSTSFQDTYLVLNDYTTQSYIDKVEGEDTVETLNGEIPFYIRATLSPSEYQDSEEWYSMGITFKKDDTNAISALLRRNGNIYIVNHNNGQEQYILYQAAQSFNEFAVDDDIEMEIVSTIDSVSVYLNGNLEIDRLDITKYYDAEGTTELGETGAESMEHTVGTWFAYTAGTVTLHEAYFLQEVELIDINTPPEEEETYPVEETLPNNYDTIEPPEYDHNQGSIYYIIGGILFGIVNTILITTIIIVKTRSA